MDNREQQEKRNKRIGWLTSIGVQLILLLLFYFLIAWREPSPPIPEYGIELGFSSSAGATASAAKSNQVEEVRETEVINEEAETIAEAVQEVVQENLPTETVTQTETITQEVEDLPVLEETPKIDPQDQPEEPIIEEQPVEEKPQEPVVDTRALMQPTSSEADRTSEQQSEGQEDSQEIDQRAIYGSQGSNTGTNEGVILSLSGWMWDFKPQPKDESNEEGKIVYKIMVNEEGVLKNIEVLSSTVSPAVERKYRTEVQKLTFSKTGNAQSATLSTGTITFKIKSR